MFTDPVPADHDSKLIDVHFLGVPIDLFVRTSQYHDEVIRELRLILTDAQSNQHDVPASFMLIVEQMSAEFTDFAAPARAAVEVAISQGLSEVDLTLSFAAERREWVQDFADRFRVIDQYCAAGKLLTLPAPPLLIAFREWFLAEIVNQLDGSARRPWRYEASENTWSKRR